MERWWPRLVDALISGVVLLVGLAEIWVPLESRSGDGSAAATTVQLIIVCAALLARRSNPLICAVVVVAAFLGFASLGLSYVDFVGQFVPLMLAAFAVARHATGNGPYVGAAIVGLGLLGGDLLIPELQDASEIIFHWGVLTIAYSLGTWQRVMASRAEHEHRRAVTAEVAAATAVADERTRMARELHDVVAHAMSVIVVQAGATELVADEPEEVRRALASIRKTGSDALNEMRRLVTMLRDPDEAALRAPQPGLAALEALVAGARESGLPVTLAVAGTPREVPAAVDLAAFRIVQESLTNARHHARGLSRVDVGVEYATDGLNVSVRDDGVGSPATVGSGHGLIGMSERVALCRGTLRAEKLGDRGFVVEAMLPLEAPA